MYAKCERWLKHGTSRHMKKARLCVRQSRADLTKTQNGCFGDEPTRPRLRVKDLRAVALSLFLVHCDPDLAYIVGILYIGRGIDLKLDTAAVLVGAALREEFRAYLFVRFL